MATPAGNNPGGGISRFAWMVCPRRQITIKKMRMDPALRPSEKKSASHEMHGGGRLRPPNTRSEWRSTAPSSILNCPVHGRLLMQAPLPSYELRNRSPRVPICDTRHESHHNTQLAVDLFGNNNKHVHNGWAAPQGEISPCALSHAAVRRPTRVLITRSPTEVCFPLRGSSDSPRGGRTGRAQQSAVSKLKTVGNSNWLYSTRDCQVQPEHTQPAYIIWRRFFD